MAENQQEVGLELVLLVDVSASVSKEEYTLQVRGLAAAFASPAIRDAVRESGGVAVCVIQWAQQNLQRKSVDWQHLRNEADVSRFALEVASMQRPVPSGQTAIGDALAVALREIQTNRYAGLRRVIDLSGDGRSNDGRSMRLSRADVIDEGVTINGLAILNEMPDLGAYFRDRLIGGQDSFVMTAEDYEDFSRAMEEKLDREIRSPPVAQLNPSLKLPKMNRADQGRRAELANRQQPRL